MAPSIVIVEDDHLQGGLLQDSLTAALPGVELTVLATEQEFREHLPRLRGEPPDLVVMDVMLRWAFPSPDAPPPPDDVAAGDYYRAGLRCAALLRADERLAGVPVVLYTILERSDLERDGSALPPNTTYVGKAGDLGGLLRTIRQLTGAGTLAPGRPRRR